MAPSSIVPALHPSHDRFVLERLDLRKTSEIYLEGEAGVVKTVFVCVCFESNGAGLDLTVGI